MVLDFGPDDFYGFAGLAMVGTFAGAAGLLWLSQVSRYAPFIHSLRGMAPNYLSVIGVLFALNLVFLANDTWHAHDRALDTIVQEAGSLRSIQTLARHLPQPTLIKIDTSVKRYAQLTVTEEWPLLARRAASANAAAELDTLLTLLASDEVGQVLDPSVHSLILQQALQVRADRGARLALSQTHVNPLKWLGMAFLGFQLMVSIVLVHVDQARAEVVAVLLFALAAAPTAAIILVQGNPFQPPSVVSAAPLADVAE